MDNTIEKILKIFFDQSAKNITILDTRDDDDDFREAIRIDLENGERYVLKLAANDFTFPDRIRMWGRTADEYRNLGYYAPRIIPDSRG
nr:hypothetical protein [Lachnospiraceae bacterium]